MSPTPTEAVEAARQWLATIERRKTEKPLAQFVTIHAPQLEDICRALLTACEALEDALSDLKYYGHTGENIGCDQCEMANKLRAALSCPAPPSSSGGSGVTKL